MDIYSKMKLLMDQHNVSAYRLAKDLGLSSGLLSQWKKRSQSPSGQNLKLVADYFGVTVDYLLSQSPPQADSVQAPAEPGADTQKKPAANQDSGELTMDAFTYALYNESRELTEENKQKLLEMARLFKLAQQAQKDA